MFKDYKKRNNLDKSRWDEDSLRDYEFSLEKELELSRNYLDNIEAPLEYISPNNPLEIYNSIDLLKKLCSTKSATGFTAYDWFKLGLTIKNTLSYNSPINRNADIINNIYLEIDMSILYSLDPILDMTIEIRLDQNSIYTTNIGLAMLQQVFYGSNIKDNGDYIQIPIANFNTLKLDNGLTGFPIVAAYFTVRDIHITSSYSEQLANTKMRFIVEETFLNGNERSSLARVRYDLFYLSSVRATPAFPISINNNRIAIRYIYPSSRFVAKYIVIILKSNNAISIPEIESANLVSKDIILEWSSEEVVVIDSFGIRQYILPITSEFKDIETIVETYSDPVSYCSLDGLTGEFSLTLDVDRVELDCKPLIFLGGYNKLAVGSGSIQQACI